MDLSEVVPAKQIVFYCNVICMTKSALICLRAAFMLQPCACQQQACVQPNQTRLLPTSSGQHVVMDSVGSHDLEANESERSLRAYSRIFPGKKRLLFINHWVESASGFRQEGVGSYRVLS